jgi:hypothetical protein
LKRKGDVVVDEEKDPKGAKPCPKTERKKEGLKRRDFSGVFTANNSTEGADRKCPFSEIFDPRQRIVRISFSSAPIDLKPG